MYGKKKKTREPKEENVTLGPAVREGEYVFGVAHIFASFNDTFVHVMDFSGREALIRITGGMKVKADCDESSPYAAMLAPHMILHKDARMLLQYPLTTRAERVVGEEESCNFKSCRVALLVVSLAGFVNLGFVVYIGCYSSTHLQH